MTKLGIDFGTTNSLLVAYDKTRNEFLYTHFDNNKPIPLSSTVWFHDGDQVEVGEKARSKMKMLADVEGNHFERSIKSKLGSDNKVSVFGKAVEPKEIAAHIFQNLKNESSRYLKGADYNSVVTTVPINFNGRQRRDLRYAANKAGIEITTFIHEPFAAVVGYFFSQGMKDGSVNKPSGIKGIFGGKGKATDRIVEDLKAISNENILVFDWGGGTLDVTVIHIENGRMEELGTAELTGIAGDKFDEKIANYAWNSLVDKYASKYDTNHIEEVKRMKWNRLLSVAEEVKMNLSTSETDRFLLENVLGLREGIDLEITRTKFEELIGKEIDLALGTVNSALSNAGLAANEISHVLLTGGSCYIPMVYTEMTKLFGHRVEKVEDADLVIAQGAAVISEMGWLPFISKDIEIKMTGDTYWPLYEKPMPIGIDTDAKRREEFMCIDKRAEHARIILTEKTNDYTRKVIGILNVPTTEINRNTVNEEIVVETSIDENIILNIEGYSKLVKNENVDYSIRKTAQIHKLCFGLDCNG